MKWKLRCEFVITYFFTNSVNDDKKRSRLARMRLKSRWQHDKRPFALYFKDIMNFKCTKM